jgi:hypothetical protein
MVAVNVGGGRHPGRSVHVLDRAHRSRVGHHPRVVIVAAITHAVARLFPGVGIVVPTFIPPREQLSPHGDSTSKQLPPSPTSLGRSARSAALICSTSTAFASCGAGVRRAVRVD